MEAKINPTIAVFDSGIGGVSVLRALIDKYKAGNFIYFADNQFMPYGNKSKSFLKRRLNQILSILFKLYKVDIVIVACNTASSCLEDNKSNSIITMKFNNKYKYLATSLTYKNLPELNIIPDATLAKQIENNIFNTRTLSRIVKSHVKSHHLDREKQIVLGCTHYELVKDLFEKFCPDCEVINNSELLLKDLSLKIDDGFLNIVVITSKKDMSFEKKIYRLLNE